ncbi:MAG TPA: hypothetical protein VMB03_20640 [Bryobacteraceae bacterium]|nr:hypothetical protein [Bryobacteraceae bacterium]
MQSFIKALAQFASVCLLDVVVTSTSTGRFVRVSLWPSGVPASFTSPAAIADAASACFPRPGDHQVSAA